MIKRIAVTLFLTGIGHLFSIFALKFFALHSSSKELSQIAEIDSMVQFIISAIAMGLQASAMRNITITDKWQEEYSNTQTARFTLGLLMTMLCVFSFFNKHYLLFAIAPILALNSDYTLYARRDRKSVV